MAGVRISGLSNVSSADQAITDDLVVTDKLTVNGSANVGNAAADSIGFFTGTGITQRASSIQATTNLASSTDFGATQLALVQEIMTTLTNLGLWKGAA